MTSLSTIVAELIVAASTSFGQPGLPVPAIKPVIQQLQPDDLQQRVCGKPCRVLAWFSPDGIIYIDARMNPISNIAARGVLLHEIVHHLQRHSLGTDAQSCKEWLRRERQAYEIQAHWLYQRGIDPTALMWQVRTMQCHPLAFGQGQAVKALPGKSPNE